MALLVHRGAGAIVVVDWEEILGYVFLNAIDRSIVGIVDGGETLVKLLETTEVHTLNF